MNYSNLMINKQNIYKKKLNKKKYHKMWMNFILISTIFLSAKSGKTAA